MHRILILMILLMLAGCDYYKSPTTEENRNLTPRMMLLELQDERRFLTADAIADRLINQDPELFLIDVRPEEEYLNFALPTAISMPLDKILEPESKNLLNDTKYDLVFYSNADLLADQAWMISRQAGYLNCYVLRGGLNNWFETIINPQPPAQSADISAKEEYQFRRAAALYFTGASKAMDPAPYRKPVVKKTVRVQPKPEPVQKIVEEEEEGC